MARRTSKRNALREAGAFNIQPRRVSDPLFERHAFFDPCDKAQVKYEMLRRREVENEPLQQTCRRFGFTRESYRQILERFRREGIRGLFDRKRGRKGPIKVDERVRRFLHREHQQHPELGVDDLVRRCGDEVGVWLSRRSVYRVLSGSDSADQKKKRRPATHGG
jgi:transposase